MAAGRTDAAPPRLGALYTLVFLFTAAMGLAGPLVPQFLRAGLGARLLVVGLVAAVYGLLQVAARVPMGAWTDRVGRRVAIRFAFVATFLAGLFFALAPSVAWVVPGQVLFALASSAFWVAANAYVVDVLPPAEVPRAMSHYSIAMGLGFLVGPPLGGLADVVGFRPALALFSVLGAIGVGVALLLRDTGRSDRRVPLGRAYVRAWELTRDPVLLFSAAITFSFAVLIGALSTYLPLHLRTLGHGAAVVGVLFTLREGTSLALRFGLASHLTARRAGGVMVAGVALAAVSVLAIPASPSLVWIGFLAVLAGLGVGAVIPANLTLIAAAAPPQERSLAMGLYGTALGLGTSMAPPALGALAERAGLGWAFVAAGAASLALVAFLTLALRRRLAVATAAY